MVWFSSYNLSYTLATGHRATPLPSLFNEFLLGLCPKGDAPLNLELGKGFQGSGCCAEASRTLSAFQRAAVAACELTHAVGPAPVQRCDGLLLGRIILHKARCCSLQGAWHPHFPSALSSATKNILQTLPTFPQEAASTERDMKSTWWVANGIFF